jgi:hypothetical protein
MLKRKQTTDKATIRRHKAKKSTESQVEDNQNLKAIGQNIEDFLENDDWEMESLENMSGGGGNNQSRGSARSS